MPEEPYLEVECRCLDHFWRTVKPDIEVID